MASTTQNRVLHALEQALASVSTRLLALGRGVFADHTHVDHAEHGSGDRTGKDGGLGSKNGQPSGVGYPTSKFAVNGMVQSLSRELAPVGIRVNAVAPGVTKTDMVANLPEEVIKPIVATIPLGRMGEPEDVANAFVFLASDMSSYVTGAVLPVDGAARS